MWQTTGTMQVDEKRTVVLGLDGHTDTLATLATYGSDAERLFAANKLLDMYRTMGDVYLSAYGAPDTSADLTNGLQNEMKRIATMAAWMAPDRAMAHLTDGSVWEVEGKDSEGYMTLRADDEFYEIHAQEVANYVMYQSE